ncbi:unnamed protein product [Haemonchus placei]|uniref:AC_N domain-containing protein n=1 Tax=Haemonchus placei TaxID=6290 RepID=A0A0N4VYE7_HAEPC|nr:unnamed protein product [Haemonchus placei]
MCPIHCAFIVNTASAAAVVSATGLSIQLINNADETALITHAILFFAINVVGFFVFYPLELVQRKTFRETRKCVETRMMLVRELDKQEKILLSVLPKHIAYEVKDDMEGREKEQMFHKIYIRKHENIRCRSQRDISRALEDFWAGSGLRIEERIKSEEICESSK